MSGETESYPDFNRGEMMSEEKLKSCPFCGGEAKVWNDQLEIRVGCCGISMTVDDWNTRPATTLDEGEIVKVLLSVTGMKGSSEWDPRCEDYEIWLNPETLHRIAKALIANQSKFLKTVDVGKVLSEFRRMILIQIEDTENFPNPETWTDNLLIALRTIICQALTTHEEEG